jgi:carboxyl-terminal processing protease
MQWITPIGRSGRGNDGVTVVFAKGKLAILLLSALVVGYGLVGGSMDRVAARDASYQELSLFTAVVSRVQNDYVEKPEMKDALLGAVHGIVEAVDPYSSYVPQESYQAYRTRTEASPGIYISKRYGFAYVVAVVRGSPAEREGIRTGDLIEAIDARKTAQMSRWEAQYMLQGAAGTEVNLRLIRGGRRPPTEIRLVREAPVPEKVKAEIVETGLGWLRIPSLQLGSAKRVQKGLRMLRSADVKGILLDVRSVAEGEVAEAVEIAGFLLPKGSTVLTVKDRRDRSVVHTTTAEPLLAGVPAVVLADGGTSGAAEILIAALKDHKVATVVGLKTDGRGSGQELFQLGDGSVLYLATRLYYGPSGNAIRKKELKDSGISPDVRAPDEDFVSHFFLENVSDDPDAELGVDFYKRLEEAVRKRQFQQGLDELRGRLVKKAA